MIYTTYTNYNYVPGLWIGTKFSATMRFKIAMYL